MMSGSSPQCPLSLKCILILLSIVAVFVGQVLFMFKAADFPFILKKTCTCSVCVISPLRKGMEAHSSYKCFL